MERCFEHNFDPGKEWDLRFIDKVQAIDEANLKAGRIAPTHMIAVMTRDRDAKPRIYKHLSPEFCLRRPDSA